MRRDLAHSSCKAARWNQSYVGWYSNRAWGERAKNALPQDGFALPSPGEEPAAAIAARAKAAWAQLIRKVYEADPLECPRCKGPMRVIALIEDPGVIRRILEHLGLWAPLATERTERSPPPGPTGPGTPTCCRCKRQQGGDQGFKSQWSNGAGFTF
jgi:hypothetical protein